MLGSCASDETATGDQMGNAEETSDCNQEAPQHDGTEGDEPRIESEGGTDDDRGNEDGSGNQELPPRSRVPRPLRPTDAMLLAHVRSYR